MSLKVDVGAAFSDAAGLLRLRLASHNVRHTLAKIGVERSRIARISAEQVNAFLKGEPRGFYSWIVCYGYEAVKLLVEDLAEEGEIGKALKAEFERVVEADKLFTGFDAVSKHEVLDLKLSVYPGLGTLTEMERLFPEQAARAREVKMLIEENMRTPSGQPSPITLLEDHPGWPTEKPDMRNIRGEMSQAVAIAYVKAGELGMAIDQKYGTGTMENIRNIVVCGIGANDMYLKDLPRKVNLDPASQRKLYSIFEPSQLDDLPKDVTADNTLYIALSRSGGTQETVKTLYFAKKQGQMKYLAGYANKGLLKTFTEREGGISLPLPDHIGGRYMWAKGLIVLIPFRLAASDAAWKEYTDAMIDFDTRYWPVGEDQTPFQLAEHLFLYLGAYNIPGILACSNQPVLEAGLRQFFQLHNEAVGKITNGTLAFGPGMEMLPFAHAGADGMLGAALSAMIYGQFVFDSSYSGANETVLEAADLLPEEAKHAGLTKGLLRMACVFPNWAKFVYSGAPNVMVTMDRVSYRNLATLTGLYQSIMYTYLIMNETNPDSNPNVAMVRTTTGGLISALVNRGDKSPLGVIQEEIPRIMR